MQLVENPLLEFVVVNLRDRVIIENASHTIEVNKVHLWNLCSGSAAYVAQQDNAGGQYQGNEEYSPADQVQFPQAQGWAENSFRPPRGRIAFRLIRNDGRIVHAWLAFVLDERRRLHMGIAGNVCPSTTWAVIVAHTHIVLTRWPPNQ